MRDGIAMLDEEILHLIQASSAKLVKPVKLIVFTKNASPAACPDVLALARAVKADRETIGVEAYDLVMDRDQTELYGIQRVPALVVLGVTGRSVVLYGSAGKIFLKILLDTVQHVSEEKALLPDSIRHSLKRLTGHVQIHMFVNQDNFLCRSIAEMAVGFALENGHIRTSIVNADDFSELVRKYDIDEFPTTIFGKNLRVRGSITEADFLEKLFLAEGAESEPDRKCSACGKASPDVICSHCKIRIQAEALDHKRSVEKQKESTAH